MRSELAQNNNKQQLQRQQQQQPGLAQAAVDVVEAPTAISQRVHPD